MSHPETRMSGSTFEALDVIEFALLDTELTAGKLDQQPWYGETGQVKGAQAEWLAAAEGRSKQFAISSCRLWAV
jgi:hypothetical protein